MDKRIINQEQFKKLVINEAKKYLTENKSEEPVSDKPKRKINLESVESLINEIESMNKSIRSIDIPVSEFQKEFNKREIDLDTYNKNKNIIHVNEGEKDKWQRMLNYEIPSDDER